MRWIWLVTVSGCAWVTTDFTDQRAREICDEDPTAEGCPTPTPTTQLVDCYADADGDQFGTGPAIPREACDADEVDNADDCDDANADIHPNAVEICDNGIDEDCSGADLSGDAAGWADADGDGFGDPEQPVDSCDSTVVSVDNDDDCDDTAILVNPDAEEVCGNTVDEDCDGQAPDGVEIYTDGDGDGFGGQPTTVCTAAPDDLLVGGDCDDGNASAHPGAPETCGDGIDQDCDGSDAVDVDLYPDLDGDGFGDELAASSPQCPGTPGFVANNDDCDDDPSAGADINPAATEICNDGIDQDCSGSDDIPSWWPDVDGDGEGDADEPGSLTCTPPTGFVANNQDCDDSDGLVNTLATEIAGTGIDEDCDGREACYTDDDGDGAGDGTVPTVLSAPGDLSCDAVGLSLTDDDCNDACVDCFIGATEVCSGLDTDCNGAIDDVADPPTWYPDADGDSYGAIVTPVEQCDAPSSGPHVQDPGDCDDTMADVNPGAAEVCGDGIDQNCDGDDVGGALYWIDHDGDQQGAGTPTAYCSNPPANTVTNDRDCNDDDAEVFDGKIVTAADVADPQDNDCDGVAECFTDADDDDFGSPTSAVVAGTSLTCDTNLSTLATDCDDTKATVSPNQTEVVGNFVDEDCSGTMDCYEDGDRDGYGNPAMVVSTASCSDDGATIDSDDCNDALSTINPAAVEVANNGVDENCDGLFRCYGDHDGDTFQSPSTPVDLTAACVATDVDCNDAEPTMFPGNPELCDGLDNDCLGGVPTDETDTDTDGYFACSGDCDDNDPSVHPTALEILGDTIDQDCNGRLTCFVDADDDGAGHETATAESAMGAPTCDSAGLSSTNDDCDDTASARAPGLVETCDGIDNDCDFDIPTDETTDVDGDGFVTCDDCNDADGTVFPGADNLCDGQPNDCDVPGALDYGLVDVVQTDGARRFYSSLQDVFDDGQLVEDEVIKVCPMNALNGHWSMATLDPPGFRMDGVEVDGDVPRITVDDSYPSGNTPILWATAGAQDYAFRNLVINGDLKLVDVHGGCLHMDAIGELLLDNVLIRDCVSTDDGGAVYLGDNASGRFDSTVFRLNEADGDGGAVACDGCDVLYASGSTFVANSASNGGAVTALGAPGPGSEFDLCTFENNTASGDGGAIEARSSTFPIRNSSFLANDADLGSALSAGGDSNVLIADGDIRNSLTRYALDINNGASVRLDAVDIIGNVGTPIRSTSNASLSLDVRNNSVITAAPGSAALFLTHPSGGVRMSSVDSTWTGDPIVRSIFGINYDPMPQPNAFTCTTTVVSGSCSP